jgi:hypothetical protein
VESFCFALMLDAPRRGSKKAEVAAERQVTRAFSGERIRIGEREKRQ